MDEKAIYMISRKYEYESTLETNISADYVDENTSSAWGEWQMVRECMQNMMDEADHLAQENGGHLSDHLHIRRVNVNGKDWWYLRDMGRGCSSETIFYLGFSGKRGTNARGEKGEGQLLAFLVAAREEIGLVFASQDYLLQPRISRNNGHPHLVLDLYRTTVPIEGTRMFVEATPTVDHYMRERGNYFPDLAKPQVQGPEKSPSKLKMFVPRDGGAKLYMKGIFVRDINALFSYNLSKSGISRDRDLVSEDDLIDEVAEIWSEVVSVKQIGRLLEESLEWHSDKLEMKISCLSWLSPKQEAAWRKAFRDGAGSNRSVLHTDDIIAREARRKGYAVVHVRQQPVFDALVRAGIKRDCDVANVRDPYEELQPDEREEAIFKILEEVASLCQWTDGRKLKVFESTGTDAQYDNRLAFQLGDWLYFKRSHLKEASLGTLLQTFVHEETHRQFGAPDESREFEVGQAKLWLDIVKYAAGYVNRQFVEQGKLPTDKNA
jgi:hypothetical protein